MQSLEIINTIGLRMPVLTKMDACEMFKKVFRTMAIFSNFTYMPFN